MSEFLDTHPIYKGLGAFWALGMILFSISIIKSGIFPKWTGFIVLFGTIIFVVTPLFEMSVILMNATNIITALTIIFLALSNLNIRE